AWVESRLYAKSGPTGKAPRPTLGMSAHRRGQRRSDMIIVDWVPRGRTSDPCSSGPVASQTGPSLVRSRLILGLASLLSQAVNILISGEMSSRRREVERSTNAMGRG